MPANVTIEWPASLGAALRSSYRVAPNFRIEATEVEDGPARYRLKDSDESRVIQCAFLFTEEQLAVFETFVHVTLDMGNEWFLMPHLTGLGLTTMVCHLRGERSVTPHREVFSRFEVSFTLEAYLDGFEIPTPFELDDPVDGGTALEPPYESVYDALTAADTGPVDVINALTPVVG